MHVGIHGAQPAHINAIQAQHGHRHREAAGWASRELMKDLREIQARRQVLAGMVSPIVKIAGDNQRLVMRDESVDFFSQRCHLPFS